MSSERRKPYPFDRIEPKWQAVWEERQTFHAPNPGDENFDPAKPKYYVLDMFPYPSGAGLHVGHPEGYTATDIIARYKRMRGFNVLHPMGWDAFGLPAEQYAIKTGQHPAVTTQENVARFKKQLARIGFAYDWQREVNTTDPGYFKWTQWIFLKIYGSWFDPELQRARPISELEEKRRAQFPEESESDRRAFLDAHRLAYVAEIPVNWCPELGTVLANEEVIDGKSEVGGFPVVRRPMRQWMLRITAYAERLIGELAGLDWPESIKLLQKNWIGKSEGAEVEFEIAESGLRIAERKDTAAAESLRNPQSAIRNRITVFTTRPDTLFGATYMVLAPENPLVDEITTPEHKHAVEKYRAQISSKSDLERTELSKEKTGVFTGAFATNPVNGGHIPIWIADYVLMGYGTGAIMAVPAHDERDWEFAEKFALPIREVVSESPRLAEGGESPCSLPPLACFSGEGYAINSPLIDGLPTAQAKAKITAWLEERGAGKKTINYKLRDWLFSRQRYWGEPFPILWENGGHRALPESELPLTPPPLEDFKPTGTGEPPLAKAKEWVRYSEAAARETNTMPQWAGSCWYYLRYCDPKNSGRFVGEDAERYWMGAEPAARSATCLYSGAEWREVVASMLARALEEKGARPPFSLPYAPVSETFARLAMDASGERLAAFQHAFDVFSVRHVWKQHAVPAAEEARGRVAVTVEDLENLPQVLAEPDSVEFVAPHPGGLKRFVTKKQIDGFVWVVEEMRGRREQLHLITFWKKSAATARDVTPKAPPSVTPETLRRAPQGNADAPGVKPGGVDLYVGGTEHAVLHLLYARFWHKVLFDLGLVSKPEPFQRLVNQGIILGEDGQKMSKSRGNVVNPDDVIAEYGADAFRCYEMFMGPLEQMKPWSMTGVEGVARFLARVWRLAMEENQAGEWVLSPAVQDAEPDHAQRKVIHAAIKKVGEDIETLSFNTAISAMMVFVNAFTNAAVKPASALRTLLILLNPFAPHLTEELWEILRGRFGGAQFPGLAAEQKWPEFDAAVLIEDEVELAVQVNGKVRDKLVVKRDATREGIEAAALASAKIQEALAGKTVRKVIVVPGKLVNIVAG